MRRCRRRASLPRALFVVGCTLTACAGPGDQAGPAADRIARVEAGLLRAVQVSGAAVTTAPLEQRMADLNVPGVSVAVIDSGRIAWAKGYGLRDVASGSPVTTETLFQAASISKPVSALGILRLVEDGRIDLDSDVNDYLTGWTLPESPAARGGRVTLRGIVTHTAGLTVHGFPGYARSEALPSTEEVLDGKGNTPPIRVDVEPGTMWRYSGGGYTVLQRVVEEVTDGSFPGFMRTTILEPAGMSHSTYAQPLPPESWDAAATGYRSDGSPVEEQWHVYPEMAAAGLWTTPTDLATLVLQIQRARAGEEGLVVEPRSARDMLTPGLGQWGLGFQVMREDEPTFGHGGSNEGFKALLLAFVSRGQGLVVMTNGDSGAQIAQELLFAVALEYGWPGVSPREIVVVDLPGDRLEAIAGTYRLDPPGLTLRLEVEAGHLVASGDIPRVTLLPVSDTRFVSPDDGTTIDVESDADGRIVAITTRGMRAARVD